jgi:hypothetical protein
MPDPVRAQVPGPLSASEFQDRQAAFVRASRPLREQMAHLHTVGTRYACAENATLVCVWTSPEAEACYHALGQLLNHMHRAYFADTP